METATSVRAYRWSCRAGLALACCALLAITTFGQGPGPSKTSTVAKAAANAEAEGAKSFSGQAEHELSATDLEAFLDGFVPEQIERADVAGATIAVVKDGKLLFAKGYGYADREKKTPVTPDTMFRPGSISKLFTWTSVMQQVEQGKIDLDRDVNDYLDFKVPARFGKPLTMRDLMTHRTGFQETVKDLFVPTAPELRPISQYLPAHMPAQIFPPGTTPAYSNYGTTVAAYIVERVSGQKFDDYVEEHLFKPLGMTHATFRQPLPENFKTLMSNGYQLGSGEAKPYEYVEVYPAGALAASAESMTHFMVAHLQNGKYGGTQILKPETAIEMHSRQSGWPVPMNAMCLGFYEESRNGHRIIGHGGDTQYFHSDLHLILDANVGFFVSYNSAGRDEVSPRTVLFDKFIERYFPDKSQTPPTVTTAAEDSVKVTGPYEVSRRFQTNLLAITTLLGESKVVADSKDHTIYIDGEKGPNGQPTHYREIGPMLFQAVDGHEKLDFVQDATGRRVIYLDYPFMVFQQVRHFSDKKGVNYFVLALSAGAILLTLLLWPAAAMIRRHYGKPLTLTPEARRWRMLARVACFVAVAFAAGLAALSSAGEIGITESLDWKIHLLQVVGVLLGIGALAAIYNAVKSWRDQGQWVWYKIWNTLLAFGCAGFFWFIYHWHLLNFNLNY